MRSLVTFARQLHWLTQHNEDPMFGVSYSKKARYQGQAVHYVPRSSLPTDEECEKLFGQLEAMGRGRIATALRLAYRGGPRFGEWVVLRPCDVSFEPRTVKVYWALDVDGTVKPTKNEQRRTTIFPRSLAAELEEVVRSTPFDSAATTRQHEERECGCGLLFPSPRGGPLKYKAFHQWWITAADAVGWPMVKPLTRSRSYGKDPKKGKGWRYTGQAQWTPHDLRHVAACWMLFDLKLDDAVVAEKMGHHSADYTRKTYAGTRGNVDEAVSALTEDW